MNILFNFFSGDDLQPGSINIWAFSDAHVPTNNNKLRDAMIDAKTEFDWDIALNGGDTFSEENQGDTQGADIVSEIETGLSGSSHTISDIYSIMGNHDDTGQSDPEGENFYYRKWIDLPGLNPSFSKIINANRPYPVNILGESNYASAYLSIGNMLIILLGDREDGDPPMGENGLSGTINQRRRVSGGLLQSEWNAFTSLVQNNTDKIIIVMSHHAIYETTIGSGLDEFWDAFTETDFDHSVFGDPAEARYSGCLAYIENSLAVSTIDAWMNTYGQYIDLWMSGHHHRKCGVSWNGRSRKEQKYGTTHLNVSPINTAHHIAYQNLLESKSNLLQINGSTMTVKTYIHHDPNSVLPKGFYNAEEFTINLKKAFAQ